MANDREHELQEFLQTEENESNERQQDATRQKDGCETQGERIELQLAEGEESRDLSNEPSVAVRGESRGRRWFSSCLRRFRSDAQETDEGNDDLSDSSDSSERTNSSDSGDSELGLSKEERLMKRISEGKFEGIADLLTPSFLKDCESNTLLLSMKVSYKLHKLADAKGPDAEKFEQLAMSVEEFIYCLLDPINGPNWSVESFGDYCLDDILDDAIGYEQKKLFTHPAVHSEMNRKWLGREFMKSEWKYWQLTFFHMWCLFDLVLSPILLAVFSLLRNNDKGNQTVAQLYLYYLESPYYKFVRDTLSYIILLFLHYAQCLSPSTIAFSGLEWSILVFFIGRYMVELKQIWGIKEWLRQSREIKNEGAPSRCLKIFSRYLSDSWNKLDFFSLVVYFIIVILRIVTWAITGSVRNNRALVIAGYLYGLNTFCLTLRAFGHVMEQSKEVGTIQIALFTILKDIRAIFWQFVAVIVAFSMAITKIYMSEKSFVASGSDRHETACKESGFSCWWTIVLHLGWSLVDQSGESDPLASVDLTSVTLARILYAAFLIMGVILLVNMLIALLSNTYQKTEDNSIKEWSFKRAVTIQTYDGYDPIPVPLNIIYRIFITLLRLCKKEDRTRCLCGDQCATRRRCKCAKRNLKCHDLCACDKGKCRNKSRLDFILNLLEERYDGNHGAIFPVTDDLQMRVNSVLEEIEGSRQTMSQILRTTFQSQIGDQEKIGTGQTAWDCHPGIRIEGPLLTFECKTDDNQGARYFKQLSPEFPHFEVIIIKTGKERRLGIGIVNEGYDNTKMPGKDEGSVGYDTDDGFINIPNVTCCGLNEDPKAGQGDLVRCTVMFEKKEERFGRDQVPVYFTLNGKIISHFSQSLFYTDCDKPLFPFISMTEGSSVLAKMCAKEDAEHHSPQLQEIKVDPADVAPSETGALKDNSPELEQIKADLVDVGKHIQDVKSDLAGLQENLKDLVRREVKEATRCLEKKLDALLARLSEKE